MARFTWLAIALTFVLLIPGEIAGYVIAIFYRWAMEYFVEGSLLDYLTAGWATVLLLEGFSGIVHGAAAGAIAVYICARMIKRADYLIVAYSNAALVIAFSFLALLMGIARFGILGLDIHHLGMIANTVGLVCALFAVAREIDGQQNISRTQTAASG
jgi:hypothetical protein